MSAHKPINKDGEKECSICGRFLPVAKFGRTNYTKDGVSSHCKECKARDQRERYHRTKSRKGITSRRVISVKIGDKIGCWQIMSDRYGRNRRKVNAKCLKCTNEYSREIYDLLQPNGGCLKCTRLDSKHPVIDGMKICSRCRINKSVDGFYRYKNGNLLPECRKCFSNRTAEYWLKKPKEERRAIVRKSSDKWKYGSSTIFTDLLKSQDGKCAICARVYDESILPRFAVDHDHHTGDVRGVLCRRCNTVLGQARDNPDLLQRMIDYLKSNTSIPTSPEQSDADSQFL